MKHQAQRGQFNTRSRLFAAVKPNHKPNNKTALTPPSQPTNQPASQSPSRAVGPSVPTCRTNYRTSDLAGSQTRPIQIFKTIVNAGSSVASIQRRLGACQDNWWCVVLYCHVCVWALVDTEIAEKSKKPKQQGELSRSAVVKMKTPPEPMRFSKAKREAELRRETRMKAVLTDQSKINA